MNYFPFDQYWPFYLAFIAFIIIVLVLDLGVFHKKAHVVTVKEATIWTVVWISLAMIYNFLFYEFALFQFSSDPHLLAIPGFHPETAAKQSAFEFLAGYVVEKTLAIDNIFVFAMVFNYFSVPQIYHHRILYFGILGALFFRAIFIALGSYLMQFHWVVVFFGALLVFTGIKMFFTPHKPIDQKNNTLIKILKKIFKVEPQLAGGRFFVKKHGHYFATPLFIVLAFIEITDIIFAVDSVPAIFALTKEPLIVFTSNIFAILGLRSMYMMLAGVMDRFIYIKYGLSAVLVFVGAKMAYLNHLFDGKFPVIWSLAIIATLITASMVASFLKSAPKKKH